jgi:ABC-2 type transport system permease protein
VTAVLALLEPRWLATRNVLRRGPARPIVIGVLTIGFWLAAFWMFGRVLGYFQTLADFGPLLTQRLLVLLFLSFFGILFISNTVTALTTFYLATDVVPLLAAPLPFRRLHHARFVETLLSSSWMVVLVGIPALGAYGAVYDAGPTYYLAAAAVLLLFLVIPAALGVLVTTMLVLVFPARGTRDALLVGVGLMVGAAVVVVRMLDPERLAHPSGLVGFAGFLAGFGASGSPYVPSTWAAETLIPLLGAREGEPMFHLALLALTAAMLFLVSATVVEQVFLTAWSRAQTGRVRAAEAERPLSRWLAWLTWPLPRVSGLLLTKDVTVFLRDASQWSQLLLLCALVAIYVYNFSALPLNDGSRLALAMRDMAAILNLGLGSFVTTAIAVRFVYPMVSLEGRAWWILRTAPVALERLWWSKFWIGFVPLVLFAEGLVVTTNTLLGVPVLVTSAFLVTLIPLMAAVVSLGLAFGAHHPKLDSQNAAQIATGFGAIIYMLTCLGLIGAVVAIEAWPLARVLRMSRMPHATLEEQVMLTAIAVLCGTAVSFVAFALGRRSGLGALDRLAV